MACSEKTRRRYATHLRKLGLLFTRRVYHTEETAPAPDLVGKMRALEYHFDALFHNTVRIHAHLSAGKSPEDFKVELPLDVVRKVATGWFQDVPKFIKSACEQHLAKGALGRPLLLPQNGVVDLTSSATQEQNRRSTTTPKATGSFSGSSFSGSLLPDTF